MTQKFLIELKEPIEEIAINIPNEVWVFIPFAC